MGGNIPQPIKKNQNYMAAAAPEWTSSLIPLLGYEGAKNKTKSIAQQTAQVGLDVGTLGQSYSAREAKKSQEEMLKEARGQQAAQMEALRKQGSAPTMIAPSESETMTNKRKRLEALRAGVSSTINTSASGVAGNGSSRPSGKAKLGE